MKKYFFLIGALFSLNTWAQNISNNLSGYFQNTEKDALYTSLYLNGDGHALINDGFPATYFQKEQTLYVFPDKSVFIFKIVNGKLQGQSSWVEKTTFKPTEIPVFEEPIAFDTYEINPELLCRFYQLNYTEGTDKARFNLFENEAEYRTQMQELCNQGLTAACGAYFGLLYMEASGGFDSLLTNNTENFTETPELEAVAQKMIALNDLRGYSLLGSYYYALGAHEKAIKIYEEGAEKGDAQSGMVLFQLEFNNIEDNEQTFEE